ncbi:hypothetical protein Ciccas_006533 [Cichlidogyrus casuarinus]|uniref:Ig-like domain-containing protein n=1 Tax=Cichlidogyrus casuarinus TaxID=1844966 RepID=A0ABD2Q5X4_9PLAT
MEFLITFYRIWQLFLIAQLCGAVWAFRETSFHVLECLDPAEVQYRAHPGDPDKPCFVKNANKPFEQKIIAHEGDDVVFPCKVKKLKEKSPKSYVSWWRLGEELELTLRELVHDKFKYKLVRSTDEDWTLQVNKLTKNDEGTYICQINIGSVLEKHFHLHIKGT